MSELTTGCKLVPMVPPFWLPRLRPQHRAPRALEVVLQEEAAALELIGIALPPTAEERQRKPGRTGTSP